MDYFITHIFIFYVYTCENTKATVIKKKPVLAEGYLNKVRPKLKDIMNNLQRSDTWKI